MQFNVFAKVESLLKEGEGKVGGVEDVFRMAMLKKMPELNRVTIDNYMRADMISKGRLSGFVWWFRNIHQFSLSKKEVVKVFIKSF